MQLKDRMIYAGMYGSERVDRLSWRDMWFYSGLLHLCDDFGLFEADAALIRAAVVPRRSRTVSVRDLESGLNAIEQAGLVKLYTVSGKRYGVLWNYRQGARFKRKRRDCPQPPPEMLAWQCHDPPETDPLAERAAGTEENRTEQNRTEGKGSETTPELLVAYAYTHCGMGAGGLKFTVSSVRSVLKAVGGRDECVVKALEYMAAQDPRTRWHEVKNPVGLLVSLAQDYRDGLGRKPQGSFTSFEQWHEQAKDHQEVR